jgi:hypothetical protein
MKWEKWGEINFKLKYTNSSNKRKMSKNGKNDKKQIKHCKYQAEGNYENLS